MFLGKWLDKPASESDWIAIEDQERPVEEKYMLNLWSSFHRN